jgi:hypothetical protein
MRPVYQTAHSRLSCSCAGCRAPCSRIAQLELAPQLVPLQPPVAKNRQSPPGQGVGLRRGQRPMMGGHGGSRVACSRVVACSHCSLCPRHGPIFWRIRASNAAWGSELRSIWTCPPPPPNFGRQVQFYVQFYSGGLSVCF